MFGSASILGRLVFIAAIVLLTGCSATEDIQKHASRVYDEAAKSKALAEGISAEAKLPAPDPVLIEQSADEIASRQDTIMDDARGVMVAVTKVVDRVPMWQRLVWLGLVAVVLVAGIVLLIKTGVWIPIRKLMSVVFGWIPERTVSRAKLMADVVDPDDDADARELVALELSQDPELRRAFNKEKQMRRQYSRPQRTAQPTGATAT